MEKPDLKILLTSDVHGYIYPTDYADGADKPMGLLKCMAAMAAQTDENTLLLDGGDMIQGSPFTMRYHADGMAAEALATLMNRAGYAAVTLGNHDFGYGLSELEAYLTGLNAVCVCANIYDKARRLPIVPYTVLTVKNGLRVGVVGVCTDHVRIWAEPAVVDALCITEPLEAARKALAAVRPLSDITVCLYHGGFERDLATGALLSESTENIACRIGAELDFDLLLTGHQHIAMAGARVGNSYAVQPPANGRAYAAVCVQMGRPKTVSSCLCPPADAYRQADAAALDPAEAALQSWLDTPSGFLDTPLWPEGRLAMAVHGSLIANFINQAHRERTGAQLSATALANSIRGFSDRVSIRDVIGTYVYPNTLSRVRISGAVLRQYLERCAEYFACGADGVLRVSEAFLRPKVEHYNYDFLSGVAYTVDVSRSLGDRVTGMTVGGVPVRPQDSFTLCLNNYRRSGTGGYEFLHALPVERTFDEDVAEAMIAYIQKHGQITVDRTQYVHVTGYTGMEEAQ